MDSEPTITFIATRKNGRHEKTKFGHHTLSEARELAKRVLHIGNGLYTEIDICTEDGAIETIQNPAVTSPVGTT